MKTFSTIMDRDSYLRSPEIPVVGCVAGPIGDGGLPVSWSVYEDGDEIPDCLKASQSVSLDDVKAMRVEDIRLACQKAIFAGFYCDALGVPHLYPCKQDAEHRDQSNLSGLVLESVLPTTTQGWTCRFWCADGLGEWALRAHTAEQIQAAGRACSAHIAAAVARCADLTQQIGLATTVSDVEAVTW